MDRHDHLRSKLCIICCGLAKSVLTPSLEKVVEAYLIINYSTEIKNLPRGICGSCQRKLYHINRGNFDRNLPEIFDYTAMKNVRIPRQGECNCMLCSMAMVRQHFGARTSKSRKCGNPAFLKKDPPKGLDFLSFGSLFGQGWAWSFPLLYKWFSVTKPLKNFYIFHT